MSSSIEPDVLVGELLHLSLPAPLLVVPDLPVLDQVLEVLQDVAADISDRDLPVLAVAPDELDELLAALLGELGDRESDDLAVVRGREAEVGLHHRLLDRLDLGRVEGLHGEHARLGRADRRHVLERRRGPVVVDRDPIEKRGGGPAGAHAVELGARHLDRLVHPPLRVLQELLDARHQLSLSLMVEMIVPTR